MRKRVEIYQEGINGVWELGARLSRLGLEEIIDYSYFLQKGNSCFYWARNDDYLVQINEFTRDFGGKEILISGFDISDLDRAYTVISIAVVGKEREKVNELLSRYKGKIGMLDRTTALSRLDREAARVSLEMAFKLY